MKFLTVFIVLLFVMVGHQFFVGIALEWALVCFLIFWSGIAKDSLLILSTPKPELKLQSRNLLMLGLKYLFVDLPGDAYRFILGRRDDVKLALSIGTGVLLGWGATFFLSVTGFREYGWNDYLVDAFFEVLIFGLGYLICRNVVKRKRNELWRGVNKSDRETAEAIKQEDKILNEEEREREEEEKFGTPVASFGGLHWPSNAEQIRFRNQIAAIYSGEVDDPREPFPTIETCREIQAERKSELQARAWELASYQMAFFIFVIGAVPFCLGYFLSEVFPFDLVRYLDGIGMVGR